MEAQQSSTQEYDPKKIITENDYFSGLTQFSDLLTANPSLKDETEFTQFIHRALNDAAPLVILNNLNNVVNVFPDINNISNDEHYYINSLLDRLSIKDLCDPSNFDAVSVALKYGASAQTIYDRILTSRDNLWYGLGDKLNVLTEHGAIVDPDALFSKIISDTSSLNDIGDSYPNTHSLDLLKSVGLSDDQIAQIKQAVKWPEED